MTMATVDALQREAQILVYVDQSVRGLGSDGRSGGAYAVAVCGAMQHHLPDVTRDEIAAACAIIRKFRQGEIELLDSIVEFTADEHTFLSRD